jgi:hypothetical protein
MNILLFEKIMRPLLPFLFTIWMFIVMYLTIAPPSMIKAASTIIHPGLGHVILFGGWTVLLGFTLIINLKKADVSLILLWFAGVGFGAFIEILQVILPFGRHGSITDALLNAVGCTIAVVILNYYRKLRSPYNL